MGYLRSLYWESHCGFGQIRYFYVKDLQTVAVAIQEEYTYLGPNIHTILDPHQDPFDV